MENIKDMLKDIVVNKKLEKVDVSTVFVPESVVGLYFSAHWCPPCRGFTPKLAEFYEKVQGLGKKFEIIFISSDRNESDFTNYYDSMPWLACELEETDMIKQKYKVSGIPTLVLLDGDSGETISDDGRGIAMKHSDGSGFPWK